MLKICYKLMTNTYVHLTVLLFINNFQVFGQRVLFKLHERRFIFDPPVFEAVDVSLIFLSFKI